jgi:cobalt-zinc-cadmium resistance protein CzcA
MSLGGLAIAIGLMVDGSVVVVENAFERLGPCGRRARAASRHLRRGGRSGHAGDFRRRHHHPGVPAADDLQGMEGKMFAPLAYTIAIALAVSLVLSLTLTPVLSTYLLKGGPNTTPG